MCIIIIIIYTYNINSMPPKRNTKKHTTNTSRHRALSSQWAANQGIINRITTTPPQQHSQIPTTNVQVAGPPTHAPPTDDGGVTTPNNTPPPQTQAPFPGGGKLENPEKTGENPKKTGRGHKKKPEPKHLAPRRKQTGQSKKKIGQPNNHYIKEEFTNFQYENNKQTNNELRKLQQNAIKKGYNFAAIPRVHVPSVAETGQPTEQDYNAVASNLQENLQQYAQSSPQQGERSYLSNMNKALGQTPKRSKLSEMDINYEYDNTLPARFDGKLGDLDNLGNNSSMSGGKRKKRTVKKKKVKKVNGKKITSGNKTQKKR
jgi:hypothetical protein